jgi:hypothetical protein
VHDARRERTALARATTGGTKVKRTLIAECTVLIAIAAIGLWGGIDSFLRSDARTQSSMIKPGMYVAVLSVALIVTALVYGYLAWRRVRAAPAPAAAASDAHAPKGAVWPVYAAIVGYSVLIPVLGYPIATVLFLVAAFRLLGVQSWPRNVVLSLVVTAVFYVLFVHYAEMIFPRGVFAWT